MKVVSIINAAPDWFAVFRFDDGSEIYEPVAVWGLDKNGIEVVGFSQAFGGLCVNSSDNDTFVGYKLMKAGELRPDRWGFVLAAGNNN